MLKRFVRNNKRLLASFFLIDSMAYALRSINANALWLIMRSLAIKFSNKNLVIIYCEIPGHLSNLNKIPQLLTAADEGLIVWIICGFNDDKAADFPLADNTRLKRYYDVSHRLLCFFVCKLFISPADKVHSILLPRCKNRVYLMHALVDIDGVFAEDAFDGYTHIACATKSQQSSLDELYTKRNIKISLLEIGYPKLDKLLEDVDADAVPGFDFIYAPTLVNRYNADSASLRMNGYSIVKKLTSIGKLIFRPHPLSAKGEDWQTLKCINDDFSSCEGFILDTSVDYVQSYSSAKLMVTDLSGTGFTYAFAFGRPVVFFAPNIDSEQGKKGVHYEGRNEIGKIVRNLEDLEPAIRNISANYESFKSRSLAYRNNLVFNVGASSESFVGAALNILQDAAF